MGKEFWRSVRSNATWDLFKEGAKLMLPFLVGFGITKWVHVHATGLMWLGALIAAAAVAYGDQIARKKLVPPAKRRITEESAFKTEIPVSDSEMSTFQDIRSGFMQLSFSQRWALKTILQSPGRRYSDVCVSLAAMGFANVATDLGQLFFRGLAEQRTNGSVIPTTWVVKFGGRLFREFPLDPESAALKQQPPMQDDAPLRRGRELSDAVDDLFKRPRS